jgi:DNA-binding transcriptional regulator LsrR (DeoR family)
VFRASLGQMLKAKGMRMPKTDQDYPMRLVVRVAQLYYQANKGQAEVATQLGLSQARVSRLLKLARETGVVRTTVHVPNGVLTGLEVALEERYALDQAVVVDMDENMLREETTLMRAMAPQAAELLETVLPNCEHLGISSWSEALLHAVNAMRPTGAGLKTVCQLIGGLGKPNVAPMATRLTESLARLAGAEAHLLNAPGVVSSEALCKALYADPSCADLFSRFNTLSAVIFGVGALPPSPLLQQSGSVITNDDIEMLQKAGAVGDVCMRFFDINGQAISSRFDKRVVGISAKQLKQVKHRIAVAGGDRKFAAIRASLRGGWVSMLVTDVKTAKRLLET